MVDGYRHVCREKGGRKEVGKGEMKQARGS